VADAGDAEGEVLGFLAYAEGYLFEGLGVFVSVSMGYVQVILRKLTSCPW
jgi:hypothetical protein